MSIVSGHVGLRARHVLAAVACALCMLVPAAAYADSFEMPAVGIHATVQPDGTLAVTETRTFEFDDDINGVYWTIPASQNEQGVKSSVQISDVSVAEDGATIPFAPAQSAEAGERGVYTVSTSEDGLELKVFTPQEDGDTAQVTVSYRMTGAVMAWVDTAELYWQFVGPDWEEDSCDVELTVDFAGASASSVSDGSSLHAWAHGPLDGTVAIDEAAHAVRCAVPRVHEGEFAEVRAAFPVSWVPTLQASAEIRLDKILDEEQAWAEEANARREQARTVLAAGSVAQVGLPALFLAIIGYLKYTRGRSPKPVFQETYFRDVPSADHPAVIATFMDDGDVPNRAFVATLMKLTDDRVISLDVQTIEEDGLFGTKQRDEYRLHLVDRDAATDPIDRAALDLYFGDAADGVTEMRFDQMKDAAADDAEGYNDRVENMKAEIRAALETRMLVRTDGGSFKAVAVGIAAALFIASLVFFFATDLANLPAFIISTALLVVAVVVAMTYRVYSQEGVELRERCEALKRWLEDFTRLNEAVPGDLVLWNKLLVMAVALGVSDEVLRQLADAVPRDLREDAYGGYYYPIYWWCYPHGRLHAPTHEMNEVQTASMAEVATSLDSSGAGTGGGFSVGGSGGVGGGGGGTF